ncbi:cytochrome c [Geobacter metallireducens GS-15]|uniref:Cytochrome c n=3 Tax=Geobacter metallireducens TaxID=28232 RepID=Q39SS9_GEOMG|nr:cytochrome c [Geobacter metallireducens GS-15]
MVGKSTCQRVGSSLMLLFVGVLSLAGPAEGALECYSCHGSSSPVDYRPADNAYRNISSGGFQGNHRTHMDASAVPGSCSQCHPGSASYTASHRNGSIRISSRINNSPLATAFRNHTSSPQSATPTPGSCTNINCHFEAATPIWGSSPLAAPTGCSACHGAAPSDGNHPAVSGSGKKHGDYLGTGTGSCASCHTDHTAEARPFAHATSVAKRALVVKFTKTPNSGGTYSGVLTYPGYLPSQNPPRNGTCANLYCHSDGRGGAPFTVARWSDSGTIQCYSCHRGRSSDSTEANCTSVGGTWDSDKTKCSPYLNMSSNGHNKLVGSHWIRKYPCSYCHSATADSAGNIIDTTKHVNGTRDVKMASQWNIVGRTDASYDSTTKVCSNVYCHSDGTTDPETVRAFPWTATKAGCNDCHGHLRGGCSDTGCHDGRIEGGKVWTLPSRFGALGAYAFPTGQEWMEAMPMFANQGAGTPRANSHPRHSETNFSCDNCHAATVIGDCASCHSNGIPIGSMGESSHLNGTYHVNKTKDVVFKDGGSYNPVAKTCSNTKCHTSGTDPVWGGAVTGAVTCLGCHGTTGADQDDYNSFNGTQARISLTQWTVSGHGRYSSAGAYPVSGNPAANFPGNPCWYCHDNNALHKDATNPFRLRMHRQYERRFVKECVYCHMTRSDDECIGCHVGQADSLAPQATAVGIVFRQSNWSTVTQFPSHIQVTGCTAVNCHDSDSGTFASGTHKGHDVNAGTWTAEQKDDVRNQYLMMGVCLQCHDDDSGGQCTECHRAPENDPLKYSLGFDPLMSGTRFIKPKRARASAGHFGYKHYRAFKDSGGWTKIPSATKSPIWGTYSSYQGSWKGGKFCWDCHDPHGDSNIYMIHDKVATTSDGRFGIPKTRADVVFTKKQSGLDYARTTAPYNGICNVCHSPSARHFTSVSGDGHNVSRVCTTCHEHRFADSHANKQACNSCHENAKPIPKHTAFGLPRDCTKCHSGTIGKRMDIMGQMRSNSHHVQRANGEVKNTDCYQCHWEATPQGLIDVDYHEGYNYKIYSSVKNAKVDLVVWKPRVRPTFYNTTTAIQFLASNIGTASERAEAAKVTNHCIGCHSDQNNDTDVFGDCKTPRQYAWDRSSIAARYQQTGTTTWGKYAGTANAARKNQTKAFSAHGNATANRGGWSTQTGYDGDIPNTRGGGQAVQCYDCHSSHGSKANGTTTSYVTFNGTKNGGNLKETQAGKGGYAMTYKASSNSDSNSVNPYNTGAGQCFDCHLTRNSGITPWGYFSTFGAISSVRGYRDTDKFGQGQAGYMKRTSFKGITVKGGHFKASSSLTNNAMGTIDGLCTPCHDPHGVSPSLGSDQAYAVPLLKGTWMTSPYKEEFPLDGAITGSRGSRGYQNPTPTPYVNLDQGTFGWRRITEEDTKFAGLCMRCHPKSNLTAGTDKTKPWKGVDRVHQTVKGWGKNDMHTFTCSKCHVPHVSSLPRLMQTNCLDVKHRGRVASGGAAGEGSGTFPKGKGQSRVNCHPTGVWPDNSWNSKTQW